MTAERIRLIVPHRGLHNSKTRLASSLSGAERAAVSERLLDRVLQAATSVVRDVIVISPDRNVVEIATRAGAAFQQQRGLGLNEGLEQARADALVAGVETVAVLHGDLAHINSADVQALLAALPRDGASGVAIAPDRHGRGTNALAFQPATLLRFRFGARSFAAHVSGAAHVGVPIAVVRRPGLAFDLDTRGDLELWRLEKLDRSPPG